MKNISRIAESILKNAVEFSSQEALAKYLKDHPDSDKSKHTVKKEEKSIKANPSDFWGREKGKLKFLTDHDSRQALESMKNDLKGLVERKQENPKILHFINDQARRQGLEILHKKNLHKNLIQAK